MAGFYYNAVSRNTCYNLYSGYKGWLWNRLELTIDTTYLTLTGASYGMSAVNIVKKYHIMIGLHYATI